jgi:C1A family cysteine protease
MGNYWSAESSTGSGRYYGWKRDKPDHRDLLMKVSPEHAMSRPQSVDLREKCPEVYDQGKLGSCTANAISFAYQFDELKQDTPTQFRPSRLFIYYNEREMEGTVGEDSGAEIRDGIKSINGVGVCEEKDWPYDIAQFTVKPTDECYDFAKEHHSVKYERVNQTALGIETALAQGIPVVFGFVVYPSFESEETEKTGQVTMPAEDEQPIGGHAVAIVGYDNEKKKFIVRNSWGAEWGAEGYCYFPYEYILNPSLCSDFWAVQKITQE